MSDASSPKSDLHVRTLSAIVMLAVAGTALWLGGWWWGAFSAVVGAGIFAEWQMLVRKFVTGKVARVGWTLAGLVYVAIAGALLVIVRIADGAGIFGIAIIVGGVIAVDVGAYFAGRSIGGPKIAPKISPS